MGDDDFFGNNATTHNPLSLDELTSLSRQLLNVAFTLYWRDDQSHAEDPGNPRYTWGSVREKVTKCLLAIQRPLVLPSLGGGNPFRERI
ncbi:uncharacterized protein LACBIDRAFT_310728 [Laccaria bicolor S238N-H82]|uniref:Predicted protein n=1 Tax=Laccaria bicolor (strain S238N-H82 / ATCC MYA-4686) TaxID=486041 RepID=B0DUZ4_LACBS|nr:uncharacterized protein LACBIDRAFT_310728 [Laccaria bicolor S238N-H82]EDR01699.1 predicted protein [Laccaria bicolor S238N-H82]|eukprot:XP_001887775.1 predicted protein [Laccaria bicolor S238N-H82]